MSDKVLQMPVAQCTIIKTDKYGEVISQSTYNLGSKNGSGYVISYTEKMCDFIAKTTAGSVVRVFMYIAHHQSYGSDGSQFGYRCSHKFLQQVLNIDKPTLWRALKYLKDNFLVHVGKVEGYTEFMVNPLYVTIGKDRKVRMKVWNERWAKTFEAQQAKNLERFGGNVNG